MQVKVKGVGVVAEDAALRSSYTCCAAAWEAASGFRPAVPQTHP